MISIIVCFIEAIMETIVAIGVVVVPFAIIGAIIKGIEFLINRYKGNKKARKHNKVYNFIIDDRG